MPSVLPPVGDPIPDTDSPLDARTQVRSNIIGANPALDIPGCKWVRASEVTVTRGANDCKVTCEASFLCRFTTSGPKPVIVVRGQIRNPAECDVVSVEINGVSVPFSKYQSSGIWYYETYNEWLYTGEILWPLCEYQLIEVTTACGDICQYRLHSCQACYNAILDVFPAVTISRSYDWTTAAPQPWASNGGGTIRYQITETLTLPATTFSNVRTSQCTGVLNNSVNVNNAYEFEFIATVTPANPFIPVFAPLYDRRKVYAADIQFGETSVRRRGNCTRDWIQTYQGIYSSSNRSISGQRICWTGIGFYGSPPECDPDAVSGPARFWASLITGVATDVCGDSVEITHRVYPVPSAYAGIYDCVPYLDLGMVLTAFSGAVIPPLLPPTWPCDDYTSTRIITSV